MCSYQVFLFNLHACKYKCLKTFYCKLTKIGHKITILLGPLLNIVKKLLIVAVVQNNQRDNK